MVEPQTIYLQGSTVLEAAKQTKRPKIEILAYSGGIIRVDGFGPVIISLDELALPAQVVLLDGHENKTDAIIGQGKPTVRSNKLFISGTLADTIAAQRIIELVRAGVDLDASVGVSVQQSKFLPKDSEVAVNGKTHTAGDNGLTLITESILKEVSLLPIGADSETKVSIAARAARNRKEVERMKNKGTTDDGSHDRELELERDRVVQVMEIATEHPTIRAKAISENWDVDQTELEVLRANAKKAELDTVRAARPNVSSPHLTTVNESSPVDTLTAAVLVHAGQNECSEKYVGKEATARAKGLRCRTLLDILARSIEFSGGIVPENKTDLIRGAFSLLDMPTALGSAATNLAVDAYQENPATWREFCRIRSVSDFKDVNMVRAVRGGGFTRVAPGGSLTHGDIGEETSKVRAETFGEILRISRTDIINDDLGFLVDSAKALGSAASRAISDEVYTKLLANLESDGSPFFVAGNNNLLTGASSALDDLDALGDAVELLTKQTDKEGRVVDIRGRTLVVPPELDRFAASLINSTTVERFVDSTTDRRLTGNPYQNLQTVTEPRLSNSGFTGFSVTAWYLMSAKENGAVTVVFLNGAELPTIQQVEAEPDVLGVIFRGFHDFGVVLSDPRAAVKSNGA